MKTFHNRFLRSYECCKFKLKLVTHMDNGLMYHVYQNQGRGPITLGYIRFYNLPLMNEG